MTLSQRRTVLGYLLLLGLAMVFMEISLLSLDFPDTPPLFTPAEVQAPPVNFASPLGQQATSTPDTTTPPTPNSPTPNPTPVIENVLPQSTIGSSPNMWLMVYGKNFSINSQVLLNGRPTVSQNRPPNSLLAQFSSTDLLNGALTVQVVDGDVTSNSAFVAVTPRKPKVPLNVFFIARPWINREIQLLLIIVFAGALGSYIHAVKSATAFIGNGNMKSSWFWWYISGPFVGMAMALVFYAVLRGGFLAGTPADEKVVNPFGVLVVGGLVGMFSDKASLKLAEIFDTLFKSGDPRTDKLEAPVITSLSPDTVQAGKPTPQTITIVGERLGKVSVVRFNSTEVKAEVLSDREVKFTIDPAHLATPGKLQVVAVDPQAGASISATLTIIGPAITGPDPLPNATQNAAYDQTFTAVDCAEPCQWSITSGNLATGLTLDAASGRLSGTPTAAGTFSFTVKVVDANNRSAEKPFELVVT